VVVVVGVFSGGWLLVGVVVVGWGLVCVGCWLLVVGCWLLVFGFWLLVVGCWLLVVGCCLLLVACCLLVVGCWLFVVVCLFVVVVVVVIFFPLTRSPLPGRGRRILVLELKDSAGRGKGWKKYYCIGAYPKEVQWRCC
jgi:hypothetical protein